MKILITEHAATHYQSDRWIEKDSINQLCVFAASKSAQGASTFERVWLEKLRRPRGELLFDFTLAVGSADEKLDQSRVKYLAKVLIY